MSEITEMGQVLTRAGAAVLSAALLSARMVMQRNAERAEEARRAGERQQRELAARLDADRELAAVGWQRVNLHSWFREKPREVAEVWASAAVWAPYDDRAREAFESLNAAADRLGGLPPQVNAVLREGADYEGLAVLLARGAAEARSEAARAGTAERDEHPSHSQEPTGPLSYDITFHVSHKDGYVGTKVFDGSATPHELQDVLRRTAADLDSKAILTHDWIEHYDVSLRTIAGGPSHTSTSFGQSLAKGQIADELRGLSHQIDSIFAEVNDPPSLNRATETNNDRPRRRPKLTASFTPTHRSRTHRSTEKVRMRSSSPVSASPRPPPPWYSGRPGWHVS